MTKVIEVKPGKFVEVNIAGESMKGEVVSVGDFDGKLIASVAIRTGALIGFLSLPVDMLTVIGERQSLGWRVINSAASGHNDAIKLDNDFIIQVRKAYGGTGQAHVEQFAAIVCDQLNELLKQVG